MVHKQAGMEVPLKDLRARPVYSTLMASVNSLAVWTGVMYMALVYNGFVIAGVYLMYPAAVLTAACLAYVFLYKRRNYKFVAEDGLYFVRRGHAVHIPWEMVKGVSMVNGGMYDRVQVELKHVSYGIAPPADEKDCRFRYDLKAIECMKRHVASVEVKGAGKHPN